jgi:hypothetical protein
MQPRRVTTGRRLIRLNVEVLISVGRKPRRD